MNRISFFVIFKSINILFFSIFVSLFLYVRLFRRIPIKSFNLIIESLFNLRRYVFIYIFRNDSTILNIFCICFRILQASVLTEVGAFILRRIALLLHLHAHLRQAVKYWLQLLWLKLCKHIVASSLEVVAINQFQQIFIHEVLASLRLALRYTKLVEVTTIVVYALHIYFTIR